MELYEPILDNIHNNYSSNLNDPMNLLKSGVCFYYQGDYCHALSMLKELYMIRKDRNTLILIGICEIRLKQFDNALCRFIEYNKQLNIKEAETIPSLLLMTLCYYFLDNQEKYQEMLKNNSFKEDERKLLNSIEIGNNKSLNEIINALI